MGIQVTAENVHDAMQKMGVTRPNGDITITWRRVDAFDSDYRIQHEYGCIVDATSFPGEEVKRMFKSAAEAARYIGALLKKHDDKVREMRAQKEKEKRQRARELRQQFRDQQKRAAF